MDRFRNGEVSAQDVRGAESSLYAAQLVYSDAMSRQARDGVQLANVIGILIPINSQEISTQTQITKRFTLASFYSHPSVICTVFIFTCSLAICIAIIIYTVDTRNVVKFINSKRLVIHYNPLIRNFTGNLSVTVVPFPGSLAIDAVP